MFSRQFGRHLPFRKGCELWSGSAELLLAKLARWELWEGSSNGDEQTKPALRRGSGNGEQREGAASVCCHKLPCGTWVGGGNEGTGSKKSPKGDGKRQQLDGVRIGTQPGQVCISLKGGLCCQQMVREKASCGLGWMCVSSRMASFLFLPRTNTPKVTFGASTATPAAGITGGFSFGAPAATSTPSSQAAAPSGFAFGSAGTSSSSTAPSGTTGGFTFSSGTTSQAGTAGFSIGTAAAPVTSAGLSFGTAPAAAASTSTATLAAASPAATPFSLGGQPAGLTFGAQPSTAATSTSTATLTTSTSQAPTLTFGTKLGVTSTAASTASTTSTTSVLGSTGPSLFASVATSSAPASSSTTGLSLGATSTGSTGTASLGTLGFGLKVPGTTAATTSTATGTTSASGFPLNLKPLTTTGATGAVTSTAATTTATTARWVLVATDPFLPGQEQLQGSGWALQEEGEITETCGVCPS
uniref:Uncharacterized protein n=1 Tax=Serinus canaria TaxID=9135 RepID=A0A8C9NR10_SERCA